MTEPAARTTHPYDGAPTRRGDVTRFSAARTTPSDVHTAMAVDPSLMASMAYSTWKIRPSGLKLFTDLSYSLLHEVVSHRPFD